MQRKVKMNNLSYFKETISPFKEVSFFILRWIASLFVITKIFGISWVFIHKCYARRTWCIQSVWTFLLFCCLIFQQMSPTELRSKYRSTRSLARCAFSPKNMTKSSRNCRHIVCVISYVSTCFHLSNWRDVVCRRSFFSFFQYRISGFFRVRVSFKVSLMARISILVRKMDNILDFVMIK